MKPQVCFQDADGNVFSLIALTSNALKKHGQRHKVDEMVSRMVHSNSYDEALQVMMDYVEPIFIDEGMEDV